MQINSRQFTLFIISSLMFSSIILTSNIIQDLISPRYTPSESVDLPKENLPTYFEYVINDEASYYRLDTYYGYLSFFQSRVTINNYGSVIELTFPGSNTVDPIGVNKLDYSQTIMKDGKIQTKENFYEQLSYIDIYPGISLHYKFVSNQVKYEFEISPGVNLSKLQLIYNADIIEVEPTTITLIKDSNYIIDNNLLVFYKDTLELLEAKYVFDVTTNRIGYTIDNYDQSRSIIIDPIYEAWSTYYGGVGNDKGIAMEFADYGDVWIGGRSSHVNFDDLREYISPNEDSFVTRFNEDYSIVRNTFLVEGNGIDWLYDVVISPTDKVFLLIYTTSTDLVVTDDLRSEENNEAILIIRLSRAGTFLSSTLIDGNGKDVAYSIKIDYISRVVIAGETSSTNLPDPTFVFPHEVDGVNGFMMILSQTASSILQTLIFGGSDYDKISDFEFTEDNDYLIALQSHSNELNGTRNYYPSSVDQSNSSQDVHIIKLNSHLEMVFDLKFGGSSIDYITDLVQDSVGNIIAVGYTFSSDFPTLNAIQPELGSYQDDIFYSTDGFVIKFDETGDEIFFSTYIGGKYFDRIFSVSIDSHDYIDFLGNTQSPDLATIGDITHNSDPELCVTEEFQSQNVQYPCEDILLGQLTYNGNLTVLSYYGSPDKFDTGSQLYADFGDDFYFIGWSESSNFPTRYGFNTTYHGGKSDVVIVYIDYVFLIKNDNPPWGNPVTQFWDFISEVKNKAPTVDLTGILVLVVIALSIRKFIISRFYNKNLEVSTDTYPTKNNKNNTLRVRSTNIMK